MSSFRAQGQPQVLPSTSVSFSTAWALTTLSLSGWLQELRETVLLKAPSRPISSFPFCCLCHMTKLHANELITSLCKEAANKHQTYRTKNQEWPDATGSLEYGITDNRHMGPPVHVYLPTVQTLGEILCFCLYELLKQ